VMQSGSNDPMCQYCFQEGTLYHNTLSLIHTYVYMSPLALYIKSLKGIYDRKAVLGLLVFRVHINCTVVLKLS
jgi:hypothetical protein